MAEFNRAPDPAGAPLDKIYTENLLERMRFRLEGVLSPNPSREEIIQAILMEHDVLTNYIDRHNRILEGWANTHRHSTLIGGGGVGGNVPSNTLIVVGQNGTISTSSDGIAFESRTSGVAAHLNGVAWSSNLNLYVAVGDSGTILSSPDGITWTSETSGTSTNLRSIVWASSLNIFLIAAENTVFVSSDGENWVSHSTPISIFPEIAIWSETLDRFLIAGNSGNMLISDDGENFTAPIKPDSLRRWGGCWAGGTINKFILTGQNGHIITSPDGVDWTAETSPTTSVLRSAAYSPQLNRIILAGENARRLYSDDSSTWIDASASGSILRRACTWFFNMERFVLFRAGISGSPSEVSSDGETWSNGESSSTDNSLFSIN